MAIRPVDLPSAAGVDYGGGDVRHFSPGDAMDVPGIQNPTRQLAQRDNLVADKLNEVIGVVNNREQLVQLPMVRTVISPGESMTVTNYRIPVGFESRVLDAAISSTPAVTDIELDIFYSPGTFGNTTGTTIVSTANEFTGGINFYQTGEFIVAFKNKSAVTLELSASILLTIRPIGAEGSLLVASVVQGNQGIPGQTGPPGPPGTPGSGGAGSPGMIWTGSFMFGRTYRDKEVASFPLYGTLLSSFIALTTTTEDPGTSYFANDGVWNPVAIGSSGPQGSQGTGGATGASGGTYSTQLVDGTIVPLSGFTGYINTYDGYGTFYSAQDPRNPSSAVTMVANGTYFFNVRESYAESATAAVPPFRGIGMLAGRFGITFNGAFLVILPTTPYNNARTVYNNAAIGVVVSTQGTVVTYGTAFIPLVGTVSSPNGTTFEQWQGVVCVPNNGNTNQYVVINTGNSPAMAEVILFGNQAYS